MLSCMPEAEHLLKARAAQQGVPRNPEEAIVFETEGVSEGVGSKRVGELVGAPHRPVPPACSLPDSVCEYYLFVGFL